MIIEIPSPIGAFIEHEAVLRQQHGEGALYVKPLVYRKDNDLIIVGGWAYLDGEPAMIPEGLTLMTITHEAKDGSMVTVARDPKAILALLAPGVTKHTAPCPHYTVTVPEDDKAALLAQIDAMPTYAPQPSAPPRSAVRAEASATQGDGVGAWILVGMMGLAILGVAAAMVFG